MQPGDYLLESTKLEGVRFVVASVQVNANR